MDASATVAGKRALFLVAFLHVDRQSAGPVEDVRALSAGVDVGVDGAILGMLRLSAGQVAV